MLNLKIKKSFFKPLLVVTLIYFFTYTLYAVQPSMTIFDVKINDNNLNQISTQISKKTFQINQNLLLTSNILDKLEKKYANSSIFYPIYFFNNHEIDINKLSHGDVCCFKLFKSLIYLELKFKKFLEEQIKEEIVFDYSVRQLYSEIIKDKDFLIMLNFNSSNNIKEKNIIEEYLKFLDQEIIQTFIDKKKAYIKNSKFYSEQFKKNYSQIDLKFKNNNLNIYAKTFFDNKNKDSLEYDKEYLIFLLENINDDIYFIEKKLNQISNVEIINILSFKENQKKYLRSKLFVFMLSTFISINYLFALFLIRRSKLT